MRWAHISRRATKRATNEIKRYPVEVRYAWPAELDLMAELAGLKLRHRWGDWNREKLNARSQKHISVYERIRQA